MRKEIAIELIDEKTKAAVLRMVAASLEEQQVFDLTTLDLKEMADALEIFEKD